MENMLGSERIHAILVNKNLGVLSFARNSLWDCGLFLAKGCSTYDLFLGKCTK